MLKIIGMLIVVIATTGIGVYIPSIQKNKYKFLEKLRESMIIMKREIDYSVNTLPSIFVNLSSKTENKMIKSFYETIYKNITSLGSGNAQEIWVKCADESLKDSKIETNELMYIKSFGACLGYLDKNMQLSNINMLIDNLEESINKYKEKYDKSSKLYTRMGVLTGIMIVIVMM